MKLFQIAEAFDETTTGMPSADEIMHGDSEYQRNWKRTKFQIKYMSPERYIELASHGFKRSVENIKASREGKLVDEYAELMKNGTKFPIPVLDYRRDSFTQEGLHRAMAAEAAGIERMPVMIIDTATPDHES